MPVAPVSRQELGLEPACDARQLLEGERRFALMSGSRRLRRPDLPEQNVSLAHQSQGFGTWCGLLPSPKSSAPLTDTVSLTGLHVPRMSGARGEVAAHRGTRALRVADLLTTTGIDTE